MKACLRLPNLTIQSEDSGYGELLGGGLQIIKSGFVLLKNTELVEAGTSNRAIRLVNETGSRYYIMSQYDK